MQCKDMKPGMVLVDTRKGIWLVLDMEDVQTMTSEVYQDAIHETWLVDPNGKVTSIIFRGYEQVVELR